MPHDPVKSQSHNMALHFKQTERQFGLFKMDEDSFTLSSQFAEDNFSSTSRLSAQRKSSILENLKRERERRREAVSRGDHFLLESNDITERIQQTEDSRDSFQPDSSYRSGLITRLVEERKRSSTQSIDSTNAVDPMEKAKLALQEQIINEREVRRQLSHTAISPRAPPTPYSQTKDAVHLKKPKEKGTERLTYLYDNYTKSHAPPQPQTKPASPERQAPPQKRKVGRPTSAPPDRTKLLREELQRQADEHFKETCTFRPHISQLPQTKEHNYNAVLDTQSPATRIQNLAKPMTKVLQKREQLKVEQDEKQTKECTFKPKTNAYKIKGPPSETVPSNDRLYLEAKQRKLAKGQKIREAEEQEAAAFSFKPDLKDSTAVLAGNQRPPIYMRVRPSVAERSPEGEKRSPPTTSPRHRAQRTPPDLPSKAQP